MTRANCMLRLVPVATALLLALLQPGAPTRAQPAPTPVTPDPSQCTAQPQTFEYLQSLFPKPATPVPQRGTVKVWVGGEADPNGAPQDFLAPIQTFFACLNAGDPLRLLGTMSDQAIVTSFPWLGGFLDSDSITRVHPRVEADRASILLESGVQYAPGPGGRIGAIVSFVDPTFKRATPNVAQFLVFAVGYAWIIDEIAMLTIDCWRPEQIIPGA